MKYWSTSLIITLLITLSPELRAQENRSINGVVTDSLHQAIPFANIVVTGTQYGGISNEQGKFKFDCPLPFPIKLQISCVGYHQSEVILKQKSEVSNIRIILRIKDETIGEVNVEGDIIDQSFSKIDPKLSKRLPDAGGGNIEGLVKSQMGVSSNNELSSQYRVRGGNYDENLVYVNDIEIYRPFLIRSGQQEGLSFINPDLISSLKFSPGGFESQYGDKMSSVLDVRYKSPVSTAGGVNLSMLGASGYFESASKNQRLTAITGVRYKTSKYLLGSMDVSGDYDPSFTDVQSFITYHLSDQFHIEALGYYSQNNYRFEPVDRETSFGTINEAKQLKIFFKGKEKDLFQTGLGALSFKYLPNVNHQLKLTATGYRTYEEVTYDIIGEYWLQNLEDEKGKLPDPNAGITGIGVGTSQEHARNNLLGVIENVALQGKHQLNKHLLSWQVKYQHEYFKDVMNEWEMRDSAGYSLPYSDKEVKFVYAYKAKHKTESNRLTAYLQDELSLNTGEGKLVINGGVRLNYWDFTDELLFSPRLNLLYYPNENKKTRYRLAGGVYYQSPLYREMRAQDGTINKDIKAQKSIQVIGGIDHMFEVRDRNFKFTSEAYYKKMTNLNPYQIDNVRIRYSGQNNAKGYVAGIDFKLHGEFVKGVESWANLSIMQTEEDLLDDSYTVKDAEGNTSTVNPGYIPRPSDQRISFSLFFQDYLPNNPSLRVNLNLLLASGLPFGPPQSPRYTATNRMPSYRRVDLGLSKDLTSKKQKEGQFFKECWLGLEIFNLFDINNTISYYWVRDIHNRQYAVPNYLTSRRLNLKLAAYF